MKIIEYEEKYLEDVKDLLVELEEYILSIDKDNLDQLHPEYREKMAIEDALLEIDRVKDAQLDKELAEIFIEFVRTNPDTINNVMAKKQ